jgi:hypothetical protein
MLFVLNPKRGLNSVFRFKNNNYRQESLKLQPKGEILVNGVLRFAVLDAIGK